MQLLMVGPADAASRLPLAPLRCARDELAAHGVWLQRLAHALGAGLPWFRAQAWPCLLAWEALVAGLPQVDGQGSALTRVLGAAAVVAETALDLPAGDAPARRLHLADRAARRQAWSSARVLTVHAADGRCWNPRLQALRSWRRQAPEPQHCCLPPPGTGDDPWGDAAARLVRRGVWNPRPGLGRWHCDGLGWSLLWPLAGLDLLRSIAAQQIADAHAGGGSTQSLAPGMLPQLPSALADWDYAPSGAVPLTRRRSDGRLVEVLPVTQQLRARSGLPPRLAAAADLLPA
ncbi:MAG: hypothetical protein KGI67_06290 [Pseudomonadota bacterium]|nr:hypothetical protein [Pseudomonadota bacterium]